MTGARTRLAADAWGSVLQVHAALLPRIGQVVEEQTGLPLSWYDVLLELSVEPDRRLRMSDLGERVVLSRTRASRIVDELETAGLVRREENADDRRSAFAVMTPAGLRRYRAAAPVYLAAIAEQFAEGLSDAELRAVTKALGKVLGRVRVGATG